MAVLIVNTTVDENDASAEIGTGLSLRDAILIANSTPEEDTIELEATTYELSIEGDDSDSVEEPSEVGNLIIVGEGGNLTIRAPEDGAVIDGNGIIPSGIQVNSGDEGTIAVQRFNVFSTGSPEPNEEPLLPEPEPNLEPDEDSLDTEIFRFQNNAVPGTYIYVGESEAQNIRENFDNFTEEGLAFQVAVEPGDDLMPMYRFQSEDNPGTYLFVGESERESIKENFADSFTEEGLAFYAYDADSELGTDFYRFQNIAQPGTYLFATGKERENILENFPNFVEEGIAFSVDV